MALTVGASINPANLPGSHSMARETRIQGMEPRLPRLDSSFA